MVRNWHLAHHVDAKQYYVTGMTFLPNQSQEEFGQQAFIRCRE